MRLVDKRSKYNRRTVLKGMATGAPAAAFAGSMGLSIEDAWADSGKALSPATMKTLAKMARDIYPHDFLSDHFYIVAVMPWDEKAAQDDALKGVIEAGVAQLDSLATTRFKAPYAGVGWEEDRVELLEEIEDSEFFQRIRGDLVVSLYNQKEAWPKFGYEGSSFEHGGYLHRGFDDIDWLPED
ncbi:Twin-arginine translocation pathway signal [Salipiger sp. P9]|uniref:Twin-arginine translocation pathway signal n=1 Tax=Salipiger pentaromativorans TaxID=2943193 RepID=UPI002157E949|nr:Twin-arginine translocation pathway signal [Salipiger pentaromativorans]MCR8547600.1 Twin-arginine translocation pathway signal [Salipiger pentaromativorans]